MKFSIEVFENPRPLPLSSNFTIDVKYNDGMIGRLGPVDTLDDAYSKGQSALYDCLLAIKVNGDPRKALDRAMNWTR